MTAIGNLKTDYLTEPLGVDRAPVFSWELRNGIQDRCRITVAADERLSKVVWESGWMKSSAVCGHLYGGSLASKTCYFWQVEADCGGMAVKSPIARFETGLLEETDWEAKWIGAGETQDPLFRKDFVVPKDPVKARVYVCGLGYYELTLNGKKVGDRMFDPAWTAYEPLMDRKMLYPLKDETSCRCLYVVHAIDGLIRKGENTLGVELGNGWYHQKEKTVEGEFDYGTPKLLLRLELTFEDGSVQSVCSDESFRFHAGPVLENNVYYGEKYDARLEIPGWNLPGFDDAGWQKAEPAKAPAGKLYAQLAPADKVIECLKPRKLLEKNGKAIYDIGRNVSGVIRIYARGNEGDRVFLRFAEELSADGTLDTGTIGWDCEHLEFILKGTGPESYQNRFFWFGGRYFEAEGPLESAEILVVHADLALTGGFYCSNNALNQLFSAYVNTQLANIHGAVPSDCPHRERLGYTGDGQITAETVMLLFDAPAFYRKWIEDIADCQCRKSGHVQHTAPFYGGGGGPGGWGGARVILPYLMYRYYGDRRVAEENYEGMCRFMDYIKRHSEGHIVLTEEKDGWCLGDWVCVGKTEIPEPLVNTYYYGKCAGMMAELSAVLGKQKEQKQYEQLLAEIQKAFHQKFYSPQTGRYWQGRQGSDAFALDLGAVPQELIASVQQKIIEDAEKNGHFDTGIFGTPVLLTALRQAGRADLGIKLLTAEGYPGYRWMLDHGATTIWETWEGKDSHNHPMFGSVIGWLMKTYGGISPAKEAFGEITVAPVIGKELSFCHAHVKTLYGLVACEYRFVSEREALVEIQIPWGSTAHVLLPGIDEKVTGGNYSYRVCL